MGVDELEIRIRSLEKQLSEFSNELRFALRYIGSDAASSLTKSRVVLEKLLVQVFKAETGREPRKPLLADMLSDNQFTRGLERRVLSRMNAIRDMANLGAHGEVVNPSDASRVLGDLCDVLDWYLTRYGPASSTTPPAVRQATIRSGRAWSLRAALILLMVISLASSVIALLAWRLDRDANEPSIEVTPREEVPDPDAVR
jgi:Domain of unknown function (DUF4145)